MISVTYCYQSAVYLQKNFCRILLLNSKMPNEQDEKTVLLLFKLTTYEAA